MLRVGILGGLTALAFLINPDVTRAQNFNSRGYAWLIIMSPEGTTNVQFPASEGCIVKQEG